MAFSSWLLALSFVAVESDPQKAPGATKIEPRRSQQSIPEGAKIASWSPPGGSLGPGRPQVPAKAALGPPLGGFWGALGGSWGRLGAPLAPLGALLGLPAGTLAAPRRLPGELREAILRSIFKVGAGRPKKLSFLNMCSRFLFFYCWCHFIVCCLPCGAPGGHANIEKP